MGKKGPHASPSIRWSPWVWASLSFTSLSPQLRAHLLSMGGRVADAGALTRPRPPTA